MKIVEEAALTDVGRQRSANEDSFFASAPVFAVADGMGGARAGEVASSLAVESIEETPREGAPEEVLAGIATEANRRIHQLAQEDETRAGMGTTLTTLMVQDHDVAIGHVGDSRAYLLRGQELTRMTEDHSLVEELVRQGKITAEEAETHPQRSIITRALGPEAHVEVETFSAPASPGDVYLLCSDGLTSMVAEKRIAEILRARSSLESVAQQLVDEANANGGRDNVTVVLVRLGEDDARDADTDTLAGAETGTLDAAAVRAAAADPAPAPDRTAVIPR
ncbi:MAG: Stp1/IreP family PP2C-type Ser/Thr phosphatase, partial [Thermoleophilaceae bacterium]|nr:Stp1/IreP family PP2C-type Ser/Thr phosphatase [Thermoleophilaceae bacterium]